MKCRSCEIELPPDVSFCDACGAQVEEHKPPDPLIGKILQNRYTIQRKLGEGGFGAVYQAEDRSFQRKVAVKTLHRHLTQNQQVVKRFHREGMAASQLEHPYAVKMYSSGETEDGTLWLAMEFLAGDTLEDRIDKEGT